MRKYFMDSLIIPLTSRKFQEGESTTCRHCADSRVRRCESLGHLCAARARARGDCIWTGGSTRKVTRRVLSHQSTGALGQCPNESRVTGLVGSKRLGKINLRRDCPSFTLEPTTPFSGTMVLGFYNARPIFFEPMVAKAKLQERKSFTLPLVTPPGLAAGVHPSFVTF